MGERLAGCGEVKILPTIGAGASLLSKGFIEAARDHAEKVLGEIQALDGGAGSSVVGCEPPEVYCLKHKYRALLPGRRAAVESIAQRAWLVEELVLRVADLGKLHPTNNTKRKITFLPHCHQRAEGPATDGLPSGTNATVELLRLCGYEVDVADAGCCGMAGTFGFEAEHYDLSMQVGERLFNLTMSHSSYMGYLTRTPPYMVSTDKAMFGQHNPNP